MKIVNSSKRFLVYGDELKVSDKLLPMVYRVCFDKMSGFYLEKHQEIEIKDEKIYGVHNSKVTKVFNTFTKFKRNLGVMLSGDKGMGKSLFAKMLSIRAVEKGLPVIMVEDYTPSIAKFISSIEQEVVVMFDEFDKTFKEIDGFNPQDELLTLIDGFDNGKKLFVITCNELRKISDYFVNRTGRFHYHFRFNYPTPIEIREYMQDNLEEKYWKEIDEVVAFSSKVDLNYDTLRSIVFELSNGDNFKECVEDLNIMKAENPNYNIEVKFKSGKLLKINRQLDMFGNNIVFCWHTNDNYYSFDLNSDEVEYDIMSGSYIVKDFQCKDADEGKVDIEYMIIKKVGTNSLKYDF